MDEEVRDSCNGCAFYEKEVGCINLVAQERNDVECIDKNMIYKVDTKSRTRELLYAAGVMLSETKDTIATVGTLVHYDEVYCDVYCLIEDIANKLDVEF